MRIEPVGCLCICDRPCAVAIAHPDKPTFLFADLPPEDIADDLLKMCELYIDSEDGFVGRYLLSDRLQSSRIARIPSPNLLNKT
jgi:predicted metal-binding protein